MQIAEQTRDALNRTADCPISTLGEPKCSPSIASFQFSRS
jgi:hypothetical protein